MGGWVRSGYRGPRFGCPLLGCLPSAGKRGRGSPSIRWLLTSPPSCWAFPGPPPPIDMSSCLTSGGSAPSASEGPEVRCPGGRPEGHGRAFLPCYQPGTLGQPFHPFLGLPQPLQGSLILTRFCCAPLGLSSQHRSEASKPPGGQGSSMAYSLLNPELDACLPGPLP